MDLKLLTVFKVLQTIVSVLHQKVTDRDKKFNDRKVPIFLGSTKDVFTIKNTMS